MKISLNLGLQKTMGEDSICLALEETNFGKMIYGQIHHRLNSVSSEEVFLKDTVLQSPMKRELFIIRLMVQTQEGLEDLSILMRSANLVQVLMLISFL